LWFIHILISIVSKFNVTLKFEQAILFIKSVSNSCNRPLVVYNEKQQNNAELDFFSISKCSRYWIWLPVSIFEWKSSLLASPDTDWLIQKYCKRLLIFQYAILINDDTIFRGHPHITSLSRSVSLRPTTCDSPSRRQRFPPRGETGGHLDQTETRRVCALVASLFQVKKLLMVLWDCITAWACRKRRRSGVASVQCGQKLKIY